MKNLNQNNSHSGIEQRNPENGFFEVNRKPGKVQRECKQQCGNENPVIFQEFYHKCKLSNSKINAHRVPSDVPMGVSRHVALVAWRHFNTHEQPLLVCGFATPLFSATGSRLYFEIIPTAKAREYALKNYLSAINHN